MLLIITCNIKWYYLYTWILNMFWISIKDSCIMIPYYFFFYTVLTVKYFFLNLPKQKCCCNMVTFKFSHWSLTSTVFHIPIVTLLKKNLLIVIIFVFIHKLLYSAPRISYFSCWVHKCLLLRMYCLPCWCSLEIRA